MSYHDPGRELVARALKRENQMVQESETRRLLDERFPERGVRRKLAKLRRRGRSEQPEIPGVTQGTVATGAAGVAQAAADRDPPLPGL
jgi:hypothetical protein